jgi:hypothetical protein
LDPTSSLGLSLRKSMEVAVPNPVGVAPTGTAKAPEKPEEVIPEMIEERRKDGEGRVGVYRYMRGKLLGKVRLIVQKGSICTLF